MGGGGASHKLFSKSEEDGARLEFRLRDAAICSVRIQVKKRRKKTDSGTDETLDWCW